MHPCTHAHSVRLATPLEELDRTWNKKPEGIDLIMAQRFPHFTEKLITPYLNPDKDDHLPAEIAKAKTAKTLQQRAAAGAKK